MDEKILLFTAASNFTKPGSKDLVARIFMTIDQKSKPKLEHPYMDFGMIMELTLDENHVLIPKQYSGKLDCRHNIALVKIPKFQQARVLAYLTKHEKNERINETNQEAYK
jgi:hypothetical protein